MKVIILSYKYIPKRMDKQCWLARTSYSGSQKDECKMVKCEYHTCHNVHYEQYRCDCNRDDRLEPTQYIVPVDMEAGFKTIKDEYIKGGLIEQKIMAIKMVRMFSVLGLKESKFKVDGWSLEAESHRKKIEAMSRFEL